MSHPQRIFIVGHHGAGKGLLAKTLAQSLGWRFVDADLGLEAHVGRTIEDILGEQGQTTFYNCQHEILTTLCTQRSLVVATDSSVVCSEKNRQLLQNEVTIWLDVSTPVQIERTARHISPLLLESTLNHFFNHLHEKRDGLYKKVAKMTIQGDDGALENHIKSIISTVFADSTIPIPPLKPILEKKDLTLFHKKHHTPIQLSEQQALYLKLLAEGKSAKEIAREIHVSNRTVEGTIAKLMESLGCTSSKELISLYHDKP